METLNGAVGDLGCPKAECIFCHTHVELCQGVTYCQRSMFSKEWDEDSLRLRAEYHIDHTHIESSPDAAPCKPLSGMEWDVNMMQAAM